MRLVAEYRLLPLGRPTLATPGFAAAWEATFGRWRGLYTRLRDVDVRDSKAWPGIYDWMHEQLQRFQKALVSRLSAMD